MVCDRFLQMRRMFRIVCLRQRKIYCLKITKMESQRLRSIDTESIRAPVNVRFKVELRDCLQRATT